MKHICICHKMTYYRQPFTKMETGFTRLCGLRKRKFLKKILTALLKSRAVKQVLISIESMDVFKFFLRGIKNASSFIVTVAMVCREGCIILTEKH